MKAEPVNVLHLTLSFAPGGRRVAITNLLGGLPRLGVQSYLCCLNEFGCPWEEAERVSPSAVALNRRSLIDFRALSKLAAFCEQHSIHIIHAHDAASQFTGALLLLRMPRIRLLMTFHRGVNFESATLLDRVRNGFANAMSGAILTLSTERRKHYVETNFVDERKVLLVPNGVDTGRFHQDETSRAEVRRELGIDGQTIVFGTMGNYGLVKGIDVALRAWKTLQERQLPQKMVLVVVGTGSEQDVKRVGALAAQCPRGSVILVGFRTDPERLHRAFDVYVHTPRADALPFAVLEAMATGLSSRRDCGRWAERHGCGRSQRNSRAFGIAEAIGRSDGADGRRAASSRDGDRVSAQSDGRLWH